jgi:hypothetical protein
MAIAQAAGTAAAMSAKNRQEPRMVKIQDLRGRLGHHGAFLGD